MIIGVDIILRHQYFLSPAFGMQHVDAGIGNRHFNVGL